MDELTLNVTKRTDYKVCNGVLATHCTEFTLFDKTICIHRPVDDRKKTRIHGWQFSVDGVPVSYIGDPGMSRLEALHSFVIRALSIGAAEFLKALESVRKKNQHRLEAANAA